MAGCSSPARLARSPISAPRTARICPARTRRAQLRQFSRRRRTEQALLGAARGRFQPVLEPRRPRNLQRQLVTVGREACLELILTSQEIVDRRASGGAVPARAA